jgi:hypothetical protein
MSEINDPELIQDPNGEPADMSEPSTTQEEAAHESR